MISAGLSWSNVAEPFFHRTYSKTKLNAQYYTNDIQKRLIPPCLKMYPDKDCYFMQDGASSHAPKLCRNFTVDSSIRKNGHPNLQILTSVLSFLECSTGACVRWCKGLFSGHWSTYGTYNEIMTE